jgi:hypothetical protein
MQLPQHWIEAVYGLLIASLYGEATAAQNSKSNNILLAEYFIVLFMSSPPERKPNNTETWPAGWCGWWTTLICRGWIIPGAIPIQRRTIQINASHQASQETPSTRTIEKQPMTVVTSVNEVEDGIFWARQIPAACAFEFVIEMLSAFDSTLNGTGNPPDPSSYPAF